MGLFLIISGIMTIIYQKRKWDVSKKCKKVKKVKQEFLIGKLVRNWVETKNCGFKIGEFSACWAN